MTSFFFTNTATHSILKAVQVPTITHLRKTNFSFCAGLVGLKEPCVVEAKQRQQQNNNALAVDELEKCKSSRCVEQEENAEGQQSCRLFDFAAETFGCLGSNHDNREEFSCIDQHPNVHIGREPAQKVKVLVGERKEAKVVAEHCLCDKAPSQAEVVE